MGSYSVDAPAGQNIQSHIVKTQVISQPTPVCEIDKSSANLGPELRKNPCLAAKRRGKGFLWREVVGYMQRDRQEMRRSEQTFDIISVCVGHRFRFLTLKETPADAEITSHKLLLRAGLVRKLTAGVYTFLPLGVKVLRKVEKIVREEMNRAGALEVLMPALQPPEIWQQSGRYESASAVLFKAQRPPEKRMDPRPDA